MIRRSDVGQGLAATILVAALLVAGGTEAAPRVAVADEYHVKAAFLVSFAKFVEWPEGGAADPAGIVVIEPDPFGRALDECASDASLAHGLSVVRMPAGRPVPPCRMLFIGARSGAPGLRALAGVEPGTLTIGETQEFLERGGIVRLVVDDGHIRIEINFEAAQRSGLRISSKLLRVATIRHEGDLR